MIGFLIAMFAIGACCAAVCLIDPADLCCGSLDSEWW